MRCRAAVRVLATLVISLAIASCGAAGTRRFSSRPIVWSDDDRRPYSPRPEARFEGYFWDAMDHMFFRPASEVWTFEPRRDAINVNALDEVPDSSWFVNRISRRPMSPEEVARGACPSISIDIPAPWRIFAGKPEGATPGFLFEDANGVRYVLKVDRARQREQATGADAIVPALYHAAGYHVPCNRVVGFTEDMLVLDPDAMLERVYEGDEPMTEDHVRDVLDAARQLPDGTHRAVVSRFIEGDPIGPWSYVGTRADDPNDVVPHEHRRELRGMFVLNAWVGHWDARDSNTLAAWIERGSGGYVRHYLIDFGECLGLMEGNHRRTRRFGHTQWFDPQHVVEDALTLGFVTRPWDRGELGPSGEVLGYFDVERFEPDQWRPDYWNGAFERHTERDAAWMARILARFSRAHIEAVARLGRYAEPITERELVRILAGRRRAILERYLTRLSPLADPVVRDRELCMTDLAVSSRLRWPQDRRYEARAYAGEPLAPIASPPVRVDDAGETVCVRVPGADDYLVLDLIASSGPERTAPARVHFAIDPDGQIALAGLERPASDAPPR